MVDETSPSEVQLIFPTLLKLPNVEYQVIAENLGLLSFTPNIKKMVHSNCYKLHARNSSSGYELMIWAFLSNVWNATSETPSSQ